MCHDFLLVFLYKIYRKKRGVGFFFWRVGNLQHCCLDLRWCLDVQRGGSCLAQSDLTQCLQYLPTCFLMAQWLQFHQPSKQSTTEAPSEWWLFPVSIDLKYIERSKRVTVWIELIPLCAFLFVFFSFFLKKNQDKFYLNHWMEFHTHSTLPIDFGGKKVYEVLHLFFAQIALKKIVFNLSVPVG